jgi:D-glycero-D-manno-heptose 1,7-bisphosphate phosphatase
MQKAIFFDRDGVINIEKEYLHTIEEFEFVQGTFETLIYLQNLGYKLFIITNQSGIGRGYYTFDQYETLTNWMKEQFVDEGIQISGVYCCSHAPDANCECRKPKIGMIQQASKVCEIDFANSWLVGDKDSDIQTAYNANIPNTIQVRSGHSFDETTSQAKYIIDSIKDIPTIIKS